MPNNFAEKANFLWSVADLIRDDFKRGKYQDVILPLTVLRRIDCVLEPTKDKVLGEYTKYKDKLKDLDPVLRKASGYAFYNTSKYTFERLLDDPNNIAKNLNAYINGFSDNMRGVIEKFDFRNTIAKLNEANLLYLVVQRFGEIDLHPDVVDNHEMGTIFEELIRRFNEALDENPGEHFTPREVIRLMVKLLLAVENESLSVPRRVIKVADPACGTGGMLTIAKESMLAINPDLDVYLYGQEVNPETFAVCKSDLYMKSADGRDAESIAFGSTLAHDAHAGQTFDYQLANPPYGKEWKRDQEAVDAEAAKPSGRFSAGTPRISDGQLLFLQHMLSHMNPPQLGGGRVAIVMNGSPLFAGDAGSGESEIRRWILENDWLETIVALPEQLFYNTGIATYIWILGNHKTPERRGKVQLIDATAYWKSMRKSLGDKRRELSNEEIAAISDLYSSFQEGEHSKIFQSTDFGYRKVTVDRPLRLNFQASPERVERLREQTTFLNLAVSKKKDKKEKAREEREGCEQQDAIKRALATVPQQLFLNRMAFEAELDKLALSVSASIQKAILQALSERDETAEICRDRKGEPEPDPDLRDTENVPLSESIDAYFAREVSPYVSDAWINKSVRDDKDGAIGKVGYEINFNRYFYVYQPLRPLEAISLDIQALEQDIVRMLGQLVEISHVITEGVNPSTRTIDSGLSWLGKMPAHWELKRAKYIFRKISRPVRNEDDVVTAFRDGQVTLRSNRRTEGFTFSIKEVGYQGVRKGDLVIHQMDGFAGAIGVSDSDGKCTPIYSICLPIVPANTHYYAHLLRHMASSNFILSLAKGIRERSSDFRFDVFKELVLPVPPLEEQTAIVDYITEQTPYIDALRIKIDAALESLREYRSALISAAVTGKIES